MNGRVDSLLLFILLWSCNLHLTLQSPELSPEAQPDNPLRSQPQVNHRPEAYNETNADAVDRGYDDHAGRTRDHVDEDSGHGSDSDGVGSHERGDVNNTSNGDNSYTIRDGARGNASRSSVSQLSPTHETTSSNSEALASTEKTVISDPDVDPYPGEPAPPASGVEFEPTAEPVSVTQYTVDSRNTTSKSFDGGDASNSTDSADDNKGDDISVIEYGDISDNKDDSNDRKTDENISIMEDDIVKRNDSTIINNGTSTVEHTEDADTNSDGRTDMQGDNSTEKKDTSGDHVDDTVDSRADSEDEEIHVKQDSIIDHNNNSKIVDTEGDGVGDTIPDNISDIKETGINDGSGRTGNDHDTRNEDLDNTGSEEFADEESKASNTSRIVDTSDGDAQNGKHDEPFDDGLNETTVISTCPCGAPFDRTSGRNNCFYHLQSLKTLFKKHEDFIYTASGDLYAAPRDSYYGYNTEGDTKGSINQKGKYLKLEVNNISCADDKKEITLDYPKFSLKDTGELEITSPGMEQTVPRGSYCLLQESRDRPRGNPGPLPIQVHMCAKLRKFPRCCAPGSSMTYDGCQPSSFRRPFRPPVTLLPNPIPQPLVAIDEVVQEVKCDHEPLAGVEVEPENVQLLAPPLNVDLAVMRKVVGQWNIILDNFCIDGSQRDDGTALYSVFLCRISQKYVKEQCADDLCLRKCCPKGKVYNTTSYKCVDSEASFKPDLTSGSLEDYKIIGGYPVCADYHLDESSVISVDGTLNFGKRKLAMHEYCTDTFLRPDSSFHSKETKASYQSYTGSLVCFREATIWERHRFTVFSVCLSISIFFLAVTIFCHMSTSALRVGNHRYSLSHMISLLLGNVFLIVAQIGHNSLQEKACVAVAFLIHLTYLATFSWLNVMCFDIWWLTRQLIRKRAVRREESSGWLQYCICAVYGWGAPFASSLVAAIIFNAPNTTLIKPDFGVKCFFNGDLPILTYFYGPIAVMFVISLLLLFLTFRYKSAMNTTKTDSSGRTHIAVLGAPETKWRLWNNRKNKNSAPGANQAQSGTAEEGGQETSTPTQNPNEVSEACGQESTPTSVPTNQTPPTPSESMRVHAKVDWRAEFWRQVTVFTLMVLCWVTEVISFVVGLPEIWILTDILNSIQGLFIFILFARNSKKREIFLSANPRFVKILNSFGLCGQGVRRAISSIMSNASSRSTTRIRNVPDTVPGLRRQKKDGLTLNINNNTGNPQFFNQETSLRSQTSNTTLTTMVSTDSSGSLSPGSLSELTPTPTGVRTPEFVGVTFHTEGGHNPQVAEEEV